MTVLTQARSAPYRILPSASSPTAVKALMEPDLETLAEEIRAFLIDKVTAVGGHLGPNLGMVELTMALHRVFDSPRDTLLFDTGHQTYVHKLLTGRMEHFDRLRQAGGLSGYPSRAESAHDVIENSHASTVLAYADGLAKARQLAGEQDRAIIAVIGDGALTGGMAFEALNNIGAADDRPVIVVLNDNTRSYAPTIGGLSRHLHHLRTEAARKANSAGASAEGAATDQKVLEPLPKAQSLFELLGFAYLGPIDGHDLPRLEEALQVAREMRLPVVLHTVTTKGKGYAPAEQDTADCMHAVGVLDATTGKPRKKAGASSWTSCFADALCDLGAQREELVAITAAMPGPTGLARFAQRFPDRCFDVGIAEQHAVTSAAGLALGGLRPVVAIYATFMGRAFDQVLMDVALHKLPITFVLDRAGITGPDGASHHGMWDLAVFSNVPGLRISAPRDAARLAELLTEAVDHAGGPSLLRLPKATAGGDLPALSRMNGMDILHRTHAQPLDVLLVTAGPLAADTLAAARALEAHGMGVTVADPRWVLPINPALPPLAARHRLTVTVEDGLRSGGMGTALAQACWDQGVTTPVHNLGLPTAFLPHGPRSQLLADAGLDAQGIADSVLTTYKRAFLEDQEPALHTHSFLGRVR